MDSRLPLRIAFAVALLFTGRSLAGAPAKELAPTLDATPHQIFEWKSKSGLRYTWVVPAKKRGGHKPSLTVILHGTGLDYRWGHANHRPGEFRPNDVVVSVDGTSPGPNGTRLFLGKREDADRFHEFLDEVRGLFGVSSVFLYGHSQGGFFVVYFAGEYPADVDGVVAHASGAWNWSRTTKEVERVAIAFLHGTRDPVVPYRQSAGARDFYVEKGFPLVHLRRLAGYNHWPNAVRTGECLSWCEGMTTSDPVATFQAAEEILRTKKPDVYRWETTVDYSAAWELLERLESGRGFDGVPRAILSRVRVEKKRVESAASEHVREIAKHLSRSKKLTLDGRPWLGHLVSLREDFRGVDVVEKLADGISYDELLANQKDAVKRLLEAWYRKDASPAEIFRAVNAELPKAFLYEGFPPELETKMSEWREKAKDLELTQEDLAACERGFVLWKKGWDDGIAEYRKIWKKWRR